MQTAFLGDVVLTVPLLREIRRADPRAHLAVLATPRGAELLRMVPAVDEVLIHDKRRWLAGPHSLLRCLKRLRSDGYDLALAAQRSHRTALLLIASGAAVRIGFEGAPGAWGYNRRVPWERSHHAARRMLALAGPAGSPAPAAADTRAVLDVAPADRRSASELLSEAGRSCPSAGWLALAPGSARATKRWTVEGFAAVAERAREKGMRVALVGSSGERKLCSQVKARCAAGPSAPVILAGRTTAGELAALFSLCRALIANDSAPAHVATAVGCPVVVIFGPTLPAFGYTPSGAGPVRIVEHGALDCRPCGTHGSARCPRGHFRCMRELEAREVLLALDELLGNVADYSRPG